MFKKESKIIVLALLLILLLSNLISAYAHSGRTDENGGHYDKSTDEYHYHHGYPAHNHTGGVCPYDFDDQTDHSGGGSGGSSSKNKNDDKEKSVFSYIIEFLIATALIYLIASATVFLALLILFYKSWTYLDENDLLFPIIFIGSIPYTLFITINTLYFEQSNPWLWALSAINILVVLLLVEIFRRRNPYYQYRGKTKEEIFNAVNHTHLTIHFDKSDLPIDDSLSEKTYGKYTCYRTSKGTRIHFKKGCCKATKEQHIFATQLPVCSKCEKDKEPTMIKEEQYQEFKDTLKKIRKYGIKIKE